MAQQLNIPAVGISSLEILSNVSDKNLAVALDARKNSAYFLYNKEIKGAVELEKVEEILKSNNFELITDDKLRKRLGGISYQQNNFALGDILAKLTYEKLQQSEYKWQELKPMYIQPPPMG